MRELKITCDQLLDGVNLKITHKDEFLRGGAFATIIISVMNMESEDFIQGVMDRFAEGF